MMKFFKQTKAFLSIRAFVTPVNIRRHVLSSNRLADKQESTVDPFTSFPVVVTCI